MDVVHRRRQASAALTRRTAIVLSVIAACAYFGVLFEARNERTQVVDTVVYAGQLASDGFAPVNTVFKADDGSAAIGINYRFPASARWQIVPVRADRSATLWLSIAAEEPQFFAPEGYVRLYADNLLVGDIRARAQNGGRTFAADPGQATIFVPPERTIGYRFRLTNGRCSVTPCRISIDGLWTFWHVFRISVTGENARFGPHESGSSDN